MMNDKLKQHDRVCVFSMLVLIIILYAGCKPIQIGQPDDTADPSAYVTKSGELAGDEVWSGNIVVEGDVVVPKGNILTIDRGTKIRFSKEAGLIVDGSLYAEGHINNPITMTSNEPNPQAGDWDGIVFSETSINSRIEYCVLEFLTEIVCHSDSLRITDSIIAEGSTAGIICDTSSPTIEDNMITKNGIGVVCIGSASPTINHNAITANLTSGIECRGASYATISYNVISNNRKDGIYCHTTASPEIAYNNITYNGGWAIYGGGKLTSNFIQGNREQGIEAVDTRDSLSSSQFHGVERVESPRSSAVPEAGVRKKERW